MAAPANTITSLTNVGIREDLQDVIYRVAPEKTPFLSNIGKSNAKQVYHEWQTEDLAAPSGDNARLEGSDAGTLGAGNTPARVGNYAQIFQKSGVVSGTQEATDLSGRASEVARQKLLKGLELRRDMEVAMVRNGASRQQASTDARLVGGASAWMSSNTSNGQGGSNGGFNTGTGIVDAATPGTNRNFAEDQVKSVMLACFNSGGSPTMSVMGGALKQKFSAFSGIADIRVPVAKGSQANIIGAAEVYVSDFGNLTLVPHPYALANECLLIDPEHWAVATLRPIFSQDLSVTGDNQKFEIIGEATLVSRNQKSSGAIRAIQ